ncbi:hypothetical protein HZC08_00395, partial [Candidatus Micrarchaeota archaeon]|nr:hypothetical protein [Candidatus Micrarchaeota archaeon]
VPEEETPEHLNVPELEIEFEKKPERKPENKIEEFEIPTEPIKPSEEFEVKKPEPPKKELKPEVSVEAPSFEPKPELQPQKLIPPILKKTPEQLGQASFGELEDKFRGEWESEQDEIKIKRKMLELTKDLFKEKSMNARERIKKQIVVLKNILGKHTEPMRTKKQAKPEIGYSSTFLSTIINTQLSEVSASKDSVASSYTNKIEELRGRLTATLGNASEGDSDARDVAYNTFISEIKSLKEQLPSIISRYTEFLTKKHSSELEQLKSSIPKSDSSSLKECQIRADELPSKYSSEFDTIKDIISKQIDSIVDSIRPVVKAAAKADLSEVLSEINNTDEGSLLYYLHSKEPETYKKYERKHISKSEAVNSAKRFLAKEKGLSAEQINKYFGNQN